MNLQCDFLEHVWRDTSVKYIQRFKYCEYGFRDPISQNRGQPGEAYTVLLL